MKKEISKEIKTWDVILACRRKIPEEYSVRIGHRLGKLTWLYRNSGVEKEHRNIFSMAERFCFLTNVSGLNVIVNHFIDTSELFDDNSDLPLNPQR